MLADFRVSSWVHVTAVNPGSVMLSAEENQRRQRQLEELASRSAYTWFPGEGVGDDSTWPAEASVLILGISRSHAVQLGRQFGQVAIVYGEIGQAAELIAC
jgi:hypothetical protein